MRNIFLALFVSIFFIGCATSGPKSYINTSTPIFITDQPTNKNIYVNFKDIEDNNLTLAVKNTLYDAGYHIATTEQSANVIIKGEVNYLRKNIVDSGTHGFVGVGFGTGRRYRHRRSGFMDFGISQRVYPYGGEYVYNGQVSLLMRMRSKNGFENYSTNLNFETEESNYSYESIKSIFNEKIAKKIVKYLNFR